MCSCQEHDLFKINPRCLYEFTSFICVLFMYEGMWSGGAAFRDMIRSSVLLGLKFTNQNKYTKVVKIDTIAFPVQT